MNAYEIARTIEDMAATSSRNEKERLLSRMSASDLGKFILNWTYNPFITYGLTAGPTPSADSFNLEFKPELVEDLLRRLSARELTGNAAEREVAEVMQAFDADGARLLYLILSKDLKCGVAETTINTVLPGLIPVFSVMRAHAFDQKKVKAWPQKLEYKLDGNRNTFICKNGNGGFFTRSGKRVSALDFLVPTVLRAAGFVLATTTVVSLRKTLSDDDLTLNFMLDGEAMMGLFEDTGAFRRKNEDAVGAELHLYDMMSLADFEAVGSCGPILDERRQILREFVRAIKDCASLSFEDRERIQIVPQFYVNNEAEVYEWFEKARSKTLASYLARGNAKREAELLKTTIDKATGAPKVLEGVMIKDPNGLYDKKKSYGWMKLKAEETEDLRVVDAFPGKPGTKYANCLGGAIVDRQGVKVRVGGGWSDEERFGLWEAYLRDLQDGKTRSDQSEFLGRLIEVGFHEVTPDGSLRHPRFVRFRDDKDGELEERKAA